MRHSPDVNHKVDDKEGDPEDVWELVGSIFGLQKVYIVRQQHGLCTNDKSAQWSQFSSVCKRRTRVCKHCEAPPHIIACGFVGKEASIHWHKESECPLPFKACSILGHAASLRS